MNTATSTPTRGRGRPRLAIGSVIVTSHLTGRSYLAWKDLCGEKSTEKRSTLIKKCLLVLLALHVPNPQRGGSMVFAKFKQDSAWGNSGVRVPLAEYLGISPYRDLSPSHLGMLSGIGYELRPESCSVTVRLSEDWYLVWQRALATLGNLPPGQVLAEAVRAGEATMLGGTGDKPLVVFDHDEGSTVTLRDFLDL